MPRFNHAATDVAKVHNLFRGCVSSAYLRLARTERSSLLTFSEPTDRTAIPKNDAAAHTAKFEERK